MRDNKFKFFYIAFVGYALIAFAANAQSIVIKNATIYDGVNNSPFVGNILIDENR